MSCRKSASACRASTSSGCSDPCNGSMCPIGTRIHPLLATAFGWKGIPTLRNTEDGALSVPRPPPCRPSRRLPIDSRPQVRPESSSTNGQYIVYIYIYIIGPKKIKFYRYKFFCVDWKIILGILSFLYRRCPFKSQSYASRILEMEYQFAEQCRQFTREFGQIVFQSSTALLGLAVSGATDQSAHTGGTSCSGYSSSVAGREQGKRNTRRKRKFLRRFFLIMYICSLFAMNTLSKINTKCRVKIIYVIVDVTTFLTSVNLAFPSSLRIDTH